MVAEKHDLLAAILAARNKASGEILRLADTFTADILAVRLQQ